MTKILNWENLDPAATVAFSAETLDPSFTNLNIDKYTSWAQQYKMEKCDPAVTGCTEDAARKWRVRKFSMDPCETLTFNVTAPGDFTENWAAAQSFGMHDVAFKDATPIFSAALLKEKTAIKARWTGAASFRVPCDATPGSKYTFDEYGRTSEVPVVARVAQMWVRAEWDMFHFKAADANAGLAQQDGRWLKEALFEVDIATAAATSSSNLGLWIAIGATVAAGVAAYFFLM